MSSRRAGRFFTVAEFDCSDGTAVPRAAHGELVKLVSAYLDPLRRRFGATVITSGFRTLRVNELVGGAPESFHRYDWKPGRGVAADFFCATGTPAQWASFLDRLGAGGLGLYQEFVHVDTRRYRARWRG